MISQPQSSSSGSSSSPSPPDPPVPPDPPEPPEPPEPPPPSSSSSSVSSTQDEGGLNSSLSEQVRTELVCFLPSWPQYSISWMTATWKVTGLPAVCPEE